MMRTSLLLLESHSKIVSFKDEKTYFNYFQGDFFLSIVRTKNSFYMFTLLTIAPPPI